MLDHAAATRVPIVLTLNDYWMICHRGQLLDIDGERCAGPFDRGCGRCIPAGALAGPAIYSAGRRLQRLPLPGAATIAGLARKALDKTSPADTRAATLDRLAHMRAAARHVSRFLAPSETMAQAFQRFGVPEDRLMRVRVKTRNARIERKVSAAAAITLRLQRRLLAGPRAAMSRS